MEDRPGDYLVTGGSSEGARVPVEHIRAGGKQTLHRESFRQSSLPAVCGNSGSGLHQRLQPGVVLGRKMVEDANNGQAVRVSHCLSQTGIFGVVVDEMELHGECGASNHVF